MKGIGRMSFLVVVGLALGAVAPAAAQAPPPPVVVAAAEATPPLPNPDAAITADIKARMTRTSCSATRSSSSAPRTAT